DLMRTDDVSETVEAMREEVLGNVIARTIPEKAFAEQWDTSLLHEEALRVFGLDIPAEDWAREEGIADEEIRDRMQKMIEAKMAAKAANYGAELMRMAEKNLLLQILDQYWKDHLLRLDHLRQGIGLRAFGQKNPLNEYKREAFEMFQDMLSRLREGVTMMLSHLEIQVDVPNPVPEPESPRRMEAQHAEAGSFGDEAPSSVQARGLAMAGIDPNDPATWGKVPRNAACPCGSGKKYKHCHGRVA
ncbi:MAG: SEC-C metal-binding domain-containing protein, partial [Alphaproteobacteria bacterium]